MSDIGAAWTDERHEQLKALWADGLTASQIASELGGITRNAVIGKVHRLGLNGRTKAGDQRERASKPPRPTRHRKLADPMLPTDDLPQTPAMDLEIPIEQRRTLLQLTEKTCRWPIGEPGSGELFFCGAAADNMVAPYCVQHQRVAYTGAPKRLPRANNFRTFR